MHQQLFFPLCKKLQDYAEDYDQFRVDGTNCYCSSFCTSETKNGGRYFDNEHYHELHFSNKVLTTTGSGECSVGCSNCEYTFRAQGYCKNYVYLSEGAYPSLLPSTDPLYDSDRLRECMNRCSAQYGQGKGFFTKNVGGQLRCACASDTCGTIDLLGSYSVLDIYTSYTTDCPAGQGTCSSGLICKSDFKHKDYAFMHYGECTLGEFWGVYGTVDQCADACRGKYINGNPVKGFVRENGGTSCYCEVGSSNPHADCVKDPDGYARYDFISHSPRFAFKHKGRCGNNAFTDHLIEYSGYCNNKLRGSQAEYDAWDIPWNGQAAQPLSDGYSWGIAGDHGESVQKCKLS